MSLANDILKRAASIQPAPAAPKNRARANRSMIKQNEWTAAEVTRLEKYAAEGLSASKIAMRMGRSLNSITGKIARLGLCDVDGKYKR